MDTQMNYVEAKKKKRRRSISSEGETEGETDNSAEINRNKRLRLQDLKGKIKGILTDTEKSLEKCITACQRKRLQVDIGCVTNDLLERKCTEIRSTLLLLSSRLTTASITVMALQHKMDSNNSETKMKEDEEICDAMSDIHRALEMPCDITGTRDSASSRTSITSSADIDAERNSPGLVDQVVEFDKIITENHILWDGNLDAVGVAGADVEAEAEADAEVESILNTSNESFRTCTSSVVELDATLCDENNVKTSNTPTNAMNMHIVIKTEPLWDDEPQNEEPCAMSTNAADEDELSETEFGSPIQAFFLERKVASQTERTSRNVLCHSTPVERDGEETNVAEENKSQARINREHDILAQNVPNQSRLAETALGNVSGSTRDVGDKEFDAKVDETEAAVVPAEVSDESYFADTQLDAEEDFCPQAQLAVDRFLALELQQELDESSALAMSLDTEATWGVDEVCCSPKEQLDMNQRIAPETELKDGRDSEPAYEAQEPTGDVLKQNEENFGRPASPETRFLIDETIARDLQFEMDESFAKQLQSEEDRYSARLMCSDPSPSSPSEQLTVETSEVPEKQSKEIDQVSGDDERNDISDVAEKPAEKIQEGDQSGSNDRPEYELKENEKEPNSQEKKRGSRWNNFQSPLGNSATFNPEVEESRWSMKREKELEQRQNLLLPKPPSESEDEDEESESEILKPKKRTERSGREKDSSTSSSGEEDEEVSRQASVYVLQDTEVSVSTKVSQSTSGAGTIARQGSVETPSKCGRKNIKKILKKDNLVVGTRQALKLEEERKRRLLERKKIYDALYPEVEGENKTRLVLDFDAETGEALVTVDKHLVEPLKPHQIEGVKFMWENCFESLKRLEEDNGSGCILAHCMGLGKTLQVIALVHTLLSHNTGVSTILVLCPLNVVSNWIQEFVLWLDNFDKTTVTLYDMTPYKQPNQRLQQVSEWYKKGGVLVLSYDTFRNFTNDKASFKNRGNRPVFAQTLLDPGPDLVVCDEGHSTLKNDDTALYQCIKKIKTCRRIILTGTPLQNNLNEFYCVVQFIKPNILGTRKEFNNGFVNPIKNGQYEDSTTKDVRLMKQRSHVLHGMLDGCIQRIDYSALLQFLPEKHEYAISIALSEAQAKMYRHYLERFSAKSEVTKNAGLFTDYHFLQRITTHPYTMQAHHDSKGKENTPKDGKNGKIEQKKGQWFDKKTPQWWDAFIKVEDYDDFRASNKLLILFDILKGSKDAGDKVLVFSQSLFTLDLIEHFLRDVDGISGTWQPGIDYFRLDGSTNSQNRTKLCKIFNKETNTRARLFLISTKAGGQGINLATANRVVIFDASWNPSNDVQSIFRIYRFGQKKECYVYRFLTEATMEEKIYERQVTKLSLARRVVDEHQIQRHYTMGTLQELYSYDPLPPEQREIPPVPKDRVFAAVLNLRKDIIVKYHEHDSLLENKEEEELTEEERRAAWREFEAEQRPVQALAPRFAFNAIKEEIFKEK